MLRRTALAVALLAPAVAAQPCPVVGAAVSPCAEVALVALPDQADALGLDAEQRATLDAIRERELFAVHEVMGDLQALREAVHDLDRPYHVAEVFALFYEIDRHEAELAETFAAAERALLAILTPAQRTQWAEALAAAVALHEPAAAGAHRGD